MVTAAALFLLASAPVSIESPGEAPSITELRARTRLSFAVAPAMSVSSWLGALMPGVGLAAEFGLIFSDRIALSVHLETTVLPPGPMGGKLNGMLFMGGPVIDWFLTERWSVGTGVQGGYFVGPHAATFLVPLRSSWRFTSRDGTSLGRSSIVVGLQASLGFRTRGGDPTFHGGGLLTVGYGWW
jgi:hypothetical protein